ncbi:MAG: arginyltransferase [Magnetococcales bacterium]|nr:arginyltransferase [Magnetococcales bacterium]
MNEKAHHLPKPPQVALLLTPRHECGYLPEQEAATLFVDPGQTLTPSLYAYLVDRGFRRSGEHVYRPHCPACNACIPVRVPVEQMKWSKSLKRVWKRNQRLTHLEQPASYTPEYFDLYRRYQKNRHRGGSMDNPKPVNFTDFLTCPWMDTRFHEFREEGELKLVLVLDHLPQGLSAVYSFYASGEERRSLGTFAILWAARRARALGLTWLYLGYWIPQCPKMDYKARFQPLEGFRGRSWQPIRINPDGSLASPPYAPDPSIRSVPS